MIFSELEMLKEGQVWNGNPMNEYCNLFWIGLVDASLKDAIKAI